jgi:hypothetical protein
VRVAAPAAVDGHVDQDDLELAVVADCAVAVVVADQELAGVAERDLVGECRP